jgi:ornithine decarboxylase
LTIIEKIIDKLKCRINECSGGKNKAMYKPAFSYLEITANDKNNRILKKREILENLTKKHPTPFLILQESEIRKSLGYFRKYIPEIFIHYAIKSNADTWILDMLKDENICFDVASAGEISLLSRLKIPGSRMILANPIKNEQSLDFMFKKRVESYTFDNEAELLKIYNFKKNHNYHFTPKAVLRIKTYSVDVQTDLSLKFGCTVEEAPYLIKKAYDLGLQPGGLAFHVGTQSYLVNNYRKSLDDCFTIIRKVKKDYDIDINLIDIGGGFPVDTEKGSGIDNLDGFFKELRDVLQSYDFSGINLYAEPGRVISASSGSLITTIIGKKQRDGVNWLFLNDGVYGCYSGVVYDHAKFAFYPLDKKYYSPQYAGKLVPYTVAGPTCDSIDIIAENVYLPADIEISDKIFSTDIGAYSIMSATKFNGFQPATVLYLNAKDKLENVHIDIDFDIMKLIDDITISIID